MTALLRNADRLFAAFRRCRAGATAIEYALIGGSVSILIVAATRSMGLSLFDMFEAVMPAFE